MKRAVWMATAAGFLGVLAALGATVCLTAGCSSAGYLWQSTTGHLGVMNAAKPVTTWLADPATPEALRERLALSQRMRDWAVKELHEPDNRSYRSYADLHRSAAVWNVVAAPELSLELKTWCFPVVGCVGYKGYYKEAAAKEFADGLKAQGLETSVYGVPAYSTLGWFGDPLLNTFIQYPEGELARMIFHELAHQIAYAKDDTAFNESFATAVERIGSQRWLLEQAGPAAREEYARFDARRQDFRALTARTRERLLAIYRGPGSEAEKREAKAAALAAMRLDYDTLKTQHWDGYSGYDGWFARANNAALGVLGAYNDRVPAFERLFEQEGRDFPRFYARVKALAELPKDERTRQLEALTPPPAH